MSGSISTSSLQPPRAPSPAQPGPSHAPDLPVAGIIPFSATDWPGKLTVTVFTQGCPLRCTYCHNPALQAFPTAPWGNAANCPDPAPETFDAALKLLRNRRGLLDGLVISGGEPLAASPRALARATAQVKEVGFGLGLHTSGYAPARLGPLLADATTRPDWIGFDVKALPADAPQVTGQSPAAARKAWESLDLAVAAAKDHGMGLQLRTTLWPGSVIEAHLDRLQAEVAARGHELVLQWARGVDEQGRYQAA